MGEPLVSVIVPVYNVEAYLARCVASLRGQTYPDLEIILVDDGSADGSGLLCDSFAREDPRIRVIHQPNAGVSAARNAGLEAASGSYVCFVDGDDWAEETMAAEAAAAMEAGGWDLCAWGMNIVEEGAEPVYAGRWREELFRFAGPAARRRFLCRWVLPCRVGWSVYCRAFRREIIERHGLRFDTACALFEDLDFLVRYIFYSRNLYYLPRPLYAYRQHSASAMHTNTLERQLAGMLRMVRRQEEGLRGSGFSEPFYLYGGTALAALLWSFTAREPAEKALARAVRSLEGSGDWDYLTAQARLADRAELRRWCGRRLGDQAGGIFRYVLTGDPTDYCRALAAQERFTALRAWKNRVLHGRRREE